MSPEKLKMEAYIDVTHSDGSEESITMFFEVPTLTVVNQGKKCPELHLLDGLVAEVDNAYSGWTKFEINTLERG